jgi:hypothetical protein
MVGYQMDNHYEAQGRGKNRPTEKTPDKEKIIPTLRIFYRRDTGVKKA